MIPPLKYLINISSETETFAIEITNISNSITNTGKKKLDADLDSMMKKNTFLSGCSRIL